MIFLQKDEITTSYWSGGTTTELAIYPENSSYKKRDFGFRISTSTVETERSDFTFLPGISRMIMVLEGEMGLEHQDHHSANLKKFETDQFSGDWHTVSFGKCIDFNLMTRGEVTGSIKGFHADEGNFNLPETKQEVNVFGLYLFKGKLIAGGNEEINLNEGDFILFSGGEIKPGLRILESSEIVLVTILCRDFIHKHKNNETIFEQDK